MTELLNATHLEQWSARNASREHLPTLVRRLILAIADPGTLRMPAAEGVGLPGVDGEVTLPGGAPPFIPAGRSVWEMGTGVDPGDKAQSDYRKRVREYTREQRGDLVFVFVSSRRWPDSRAWIDRRKKKDDHGWADIRVLDAENLAAWLELCPGVHGWLASQQFGWDPYGVVGLRDWYRTWAERTQPAIPPALLLAGRAKQALDVQQSLHTEPHDQIVAAASLEESIAFLAACLLAGPARPDPATADPSVDELASRYGFTPARTDGTEPTPPPGEDESTPAAGPTDAGAAAGLDAILERTLVVEDARAWRRMTAHERPLVLVPMFAEPAIGDALRAEHHVVLPRSDRPEEELLPQLQRDLAREVWIAAGVDHDRADRYARAARRSLTSFRRQIGRAGWLRRPQWSEGTSANLLAPLLLAGAWADDVLGDLEVVSALTGREWRATSRDLITLASGEDAPLLHRGRRWEFANPVDAWDALSRALIPEDLEAFRSQALAVLSEPDPAANLSVLEHLEAARSETGPQRRRYSNALRRGMATTAAILGAVGGDRRLAGGSTGQQHATQVVHQLLHAADATRWQTTADLLPLLAEAAPESFLGCVERSLDQPNPPIMTLFVEKSDDLTFGSPYAHTWLLWALEKLFWSPTLLSRVVVILGRLADRDPGGLGADRCSALLAAALRLRFPQSAVNTTARIAILDAVRAAAPAAAWKLSLYLVKPSNRGMLWVSGPTLRDWPRPTYGTVYDMVDGLDALADRIARDAGADPDRLAAALAVIDRFREPGRLKLLAAVDTAWPALQDDDRRTVLSGLADRVTRRRRHPTWHSARRDRVLKPLEAFLDAHALPGNRPEDAELFSWSPFGRGLDRDSDDPEALASARTGAIERGLAEGLPAVFHLAAASKIPFAVGESLAAVTSEYDSAVLDQLSGPAQPLRLLATGLAVHRQRQDPQWLAAMTTARPAQAAALCCTAEINQALLTLLDGLDTNVQDEFWRGMQPWGVPDDLAPIVTRHLLQHGRAWSAIYLLGHAGFGTDLDLAIETLQAPARGAAEDASSALSPEYTVGHLLDHLQDAGADDTVLADLEWFYQPLLEQNRTPQALHRELARHPPRFVELVSLVYPPEPSTEAPAADVNEADPAASSRAFSAAFAVLREWHTPLPGSRDGQLPATEEMLAWVEAVSEQLTGLGRAAFLPVVLGDALSGGVTDEDGVWPSRPVRDVLEVLRDSDVEEHLATVRRNQRNVTTRGVYDGGEQERAIARRYESHADQVRDRWPRSGALLDQLSQSYRDEARWHDQSAEEQGDR